ncbi:MAG: RHS repeat-associated core domain-containing protein, partial [Kiritimatiellia bacterium]
RLHTIISGGHNVSYWETVSHERYLYRGYLRIAALDMLNNAALIHTVVWDPTEPAATRPLLLQTLSGWFTYAFDQAKNVTELFDSAGGIAAAYDHGPFGEDMAAAGPAAGLNPFRFSSEVWDGALGLVCYTFRPYNPLDGRFISRDPIEEQGGLNLYGFVGNDPVNKIDSLGREIIGTEGNWTYSALWGTVPYSKYGTLDVRVIYTMDTEERKCCDAVHVDRYVRKFLMYGAIGPYVLDHGTEGGYNEANGTAEEDEPDGPSFTFGIYRSAWSWAFKWVATCARGQHKGKVYSVLKKTYRTSGHFINQPYSVWFE